MGCCESKLLGLEPTSEKYESPAIGLNSHYVSPNKKKQLATIGLAKEKEQKQNTDRCSIDSLKSGLDVIFKTFQKEKGPITYTFLDKPIEIHDYSLKQNTSVKQDNLNISVPVASDKKSFSDTDFHSQNDESSQSNEVSQFFQNNTKILSNASIKTKRLLEKELFYINTNQLGTTKLSKWVQQGRLAFDLKQSDLIHMNTFQICPSFIAALLLICNYQQKNKVKLLAVKQLQNGIGFRVFLNGIKRMLVLEVVTKQANQLIQNILWKLQKFKQLQISNWIYIVTGWIPQQINLTIFPNTGQIFQRLAKNYTNGNLIISFENVNQEQYLLVKDVNIEEQKVCVTKFSKANNLACSPCHQQWLSWQAVSESYQNLNVNWNPLIYSFTKKVQGLSTISQTKEGLTYRSKPTFLIDIPPSKSEVEVRLLIQVHHTGQSQSKQNNFKINLHQHQIGFLKSDQQIPIRTATSNNPTFLSQIFIFQKSYQQSQYILVIDFQNTQQQNQEDIQITIDFYTFCQINIKTLIEPQLLSSLQIQSEITQQNAGYGMNSPFFNKNLHYSLFIAKDGICRIKLNAQTKCPMIFELCLLPDNNNYKDLTLIRPQQLVKDIIQSDQFQGQGIFQFPCSQGRYILMLVCFTRTQGLVKINIQNHSNYQCLQTNQILNPFEVVKLTPNLTFLQQIQFQWKSQCPGPRKRTKSNCQSICYPIFTFDKFFENPFVDYVLSKGLYQFSISSKSFADSCQPEQILNQNEDINIKILSASPPSLSMGIYELLDGKTQAKIILDDYQYVPYGIGFWAAPLELEGQYRFVFSKMERGNQIGTFRIRKIGNI